MVGIEAQMMNDDDMFDPSQFRLIVELGLLKFKSSLVILLNMLN